MAKPRKKRSNRKSSRTSGRRPRRSKISKAARRTRQRTSVKEIKRIDAIGNTDEVDAAAPSIRLMNGLSMGTDNWQRVGRMAAWKSLELEVDLVPAPAVANTTYTDDIIHCAVVWSDDGGAMPTVGEIFESVTNAGTSTTAKGWTFPNWNQKDRYTILWQHRWITPKYTSGAATGIPIGSTSIGPMNPMANFQVRKYIKLKGLRTKFSGVDFTINDIATGSLFFVTMSQFGAGAAWEVKNSWRLTYIDE